MINKYLKVKLENILIDNYIEIENEFDIPETLSVYKLSDSFDDNVKLRLSSLPKLIKDMNRLQFNDFDIRLYTNSLRDTIIVLYSRSRCSLEVLLTSDKEVKIDSDVNELVEIPIEDDKEDEVPEVKKEGEVSSENLVRNLNDYIELVDSISEKYGKVTDNLTILRSIELEKTFHKDSDCSFIAETLFNQLNRTMYFFTEKKLDKLDIKSIQDKINEKSLFQWNLRVTEVERDGKFTIGVQFTSKNPDNDIFHKDPGLGTEFRLYLEDNNSGEIYAQSKDIDNIYFDIIDKSNLFITMKQPIEAIHDVAQNCKMKIFKYNLRCADKVTNETSSDYWSDKTKFVPEYVDTVFIRDKVDVIKSKLDNNSNFYTIKLI